MKPYRCSDSAYSVRKRHDWKLETTQKEQFVPTKVSAVFAKLFNKGIRRHAGAQARKNRLVGSERGTDHIMI